MLILSEYNFEELWCISKLFFYQFRTTLFSYKNTDSDENTQYVG